MKTVALMLGLLSAAAQAQDRQGCTDVIEHTLRTARPPATGLGDVVAQHCKSWPPSAGRVSAAVMAFRSGAQPAEGEAWEVVVALLDARTSQPTHWRWTHVESDALTGINEYSFKLDTAAYQLTPQLRALGLRFYSSANGSRYAEAYWGDELTLFAPEGSSLRAVLGVATQAQAQVGREQESWQVAKLSLAMGSPGGSGWSDIVITDTGDKASHQPRRWTYRYDGTAYRLLANPAPFWASYCCALTW